MSRQAELVDFFIFGPAVDAGSLTPGVPGTFRIGFPVNNHFNTKEWGKPSFRANLDGEYIECTPPHQAQHETNFYEVTLRAPREGTLTLEAFFPEGRHASLRKSKTIQLPVRTEVLWMMGSGLLTGQTITLPRACALEGLTGVTVEQVSASSGHVVVVTSVGQVLVMGSNAAGELGTGDLEPRTELTLLKDAPQQIKKAIVRDMATILLDAQGNVFCCGLRQDEEVRKNYTVSTFTNTRFKVPPGMETVRCSQCCFAGDLALCLDDRTGKVWEFGRFGRRTVGGGSLASPVRGRECVDFEKCGPVRLLGASVLHRVAISEDGKLWVGQATTTFPPTLIMSDSYNEIKEQNCHPAMAAKKLKSQNFGLVFSKVTKMVCTRSEVSFLTPNGCVYQFRLDENRNAPRTYALGQQRWSLLPLAEAAQGPKNNFPAIIDISAGSSHFIALDAEGGLWGWGASAEAQLGKVAPFCVPTSVEKIDGIPRAYHVSCSGSLVVITTGMRKSWIGSQMLEMWKSDVRYKDCTLRSSTGAEIGLHAVILACRSGCRDSWKTRDQMTVIDVGNVSSESLNMFCEYLYSDRLSSFPASLSPAMSEMMSLARMFKLNRLEALLDGQVIVQDSLLPSDLASTVGAFEFLSDFRVIVRISSDAELSASGSSLNNNNSSESVHIIPCHRFLLQRSDYFKALLESSFVESQRGEMLVDDAPLNGVRRMLRYVCSDVINDCDANDAIDVLLVCNALMLPELKAKMEVEVLKSIDAESAAFVFEIGVLADCPDLRRVCVELSITQAANERKTIMKKVQEEMSEAARQMFMEEYAEAFKKLGNSDKKK